MPPLSYLHDKNAAQILQPRPSTQGSADCENKTFTQ